MTGTATDDAGGVAGGSVVGVLQDWLATARARGYGEGEGGRDPGEVALFATAALTLARLRAAGEGVDDGRAVDPGAEAVDLVGWLVERFRTDARTDGLGRVVADDGHGDRLPAAAVPERPGLGGDWEPPVAPAAHATVALCRVGAFADDRRPEAIALGLADRQVAGTADDEGSARRGPTPAGAPPAPVAAAVDARRLLTLEAAFGDDTFRHRAERLLDRAAERAPDEWRLSARRDRSPSAGNRAAVVEALARHRAVTRAGGEAVDPGRDGERADDDGRADRYGDALSAGLTACRADPGDGHAVARTVRALSVGGDLAGAERHLPAVLAGVEGRDTRTLALSCGAVATYLRACRLDRR